MADMNFQTHDSSNIATPTDCGKPQQGAGYARSVGVAPPAPCDLPAVTITSTRILRLPEVMARIGICRASIYQHMAAGSFPKQIALGPRAVGWLEHEIDAWLAARMQTRQAKGK